MQQCSSYSFRYLSLRGTFVLVLKVDIRAVSADLGCIGSLCWKRDKPPRENATPRAKCFCTRRKKQRLINSLLERHSINQSINPSIHPSNEPRMNGKINQSINQSTTMNYSELFFSEHRILISYDFNSQTNHCPKMQNHKPADTRAASRATGWQSRITSRKWPKTP